MAEKLRTSCLDAEDAKALRVRPADAKELAALGLPQKTAFEIPYFGLQGQPTKFKRWRYLEDTREGFAAMTDQKPVRYVQAKDSLQEAYLPPLVDWQAVSQDPDAPVAITEGELKAACATKYATPTIGLGGVWSFKSKRRKKPLLDVFYDFVWKERHVTILYDSDAATNPMVVQARSALARELLAMGALVHVADVPPAEDGSKQGLDDFCLAEGPEELQELMLSGLPFEASAVLHDLNEEVVYVRDPGVVARYGDAFKMRPGDFTGHAYSNRLITEFYTDKEGNAKERVKSAARAWLDWPSRGELARFTFMPGADRVTDAGEFNTWSGWGCEPRKGSVEPWRKLLDHLFGKEKSLRQWFERWLAIPLQRPGSKMFTSAVVWGRSTGTGKSLVGYSMKRIYGECFEEIGDKELQDARYEWAIGKLFIMGDDVTGHDQRNLADRLKRMITQERMRVDPKFIPSYSVPDFINYYFTSNHPDAFFLEDDDRRMLVHEVTCAPLDAQFYEDYRQWLGSGGAEALFHHLLTLDLGDQKAQDRAPMTGAKERMMEDGMSDLGTWVRRLKSDPDVLLKFGEARLQGDLWTAAELHRLYDPEQKRRATVAAMAKELKRAGVPQVLGGQQVRTKAGQLRLFVVRNHASWAGDRPPKLVSAHYDTTRGPVEKQRKY